MTDRCMFVDELSRLLCKGGFDHEQAEQLTIRMHDAEIAGYEMSRLEDTLWAKLTEIMQRGR